MVNLEKLRVRVEGLLRRKEGLEEQLKRTHRKATPRAYTDCRMKLKGIEHSLKLLMEQFRSIGVTTRVFKVKLEIDKSEVEVLYSDLEQKRDIDYLLIRDFKNLNYRVLSIEEVELGKPNPKLG